MDIYFLNTECNYVSSYVSKTIQTDHIVVLAKLIREVDWAPVNNDLCKSYFVINQRKLLFVIQVPYNFNIICFFLACILDSHQNVSSSIGIFTHNLIARDYLSGKQQDEFIELLGIKIPQDTVDKKWPLQIYPRTLAILAQVHILYYNLNNF